MQVFKSRQYLVNIVWVSGIQGVNPYGPSGFLNFCILWNINKHVRQYSKLKLLLKSESNIIKKKQARIGNYLINI